MERNERVMMEEESDGERRKRRVRKKRFKQKMRQSDGKLKWSGVEWRKTVGETIRLKNRIIMGAH